MFRFSRGWAKCPTACVEQAKLAFDVLTITLFSRNHCWQGECTGSVAERLRNLERAHASQRQMLQAVSRCSHDCDDLLERLREGGF